jgi:high affinity Mn2+ porin
MLLGGAWSYDQLTRTQLAGVPLGGSANAGTVESPFLWRLGWTAGAGVEVALGANWTATFYSLILAAQA